MPNLGKFSILYVSVAFCMHATALETLDDVSMSEVSGQDGIEITAEMSDASIDQVRWIDGNLTSNGDPDSNATGSLIFGKTDLTDTLQQPITIKPVSGDIKVATSITLETGSTVANNKPGLKAMFSLGSADINIPSLSLCAADASECKKLGSLAITNSGKNTQFTLITTNGLFNKEGTTQLKAIIDDMTVAIKQNNDNGNGNVLNQLMLGSMYANMTADGSLFVEDTKGIQFVGKVSFEEKQFDGQDRQGLELLVQHQKGSSNLQNSNDIKTLGKIALTGKISDVGFALRGVKDNEPLVSSLGFKNGTNGIALRMSGNFNSNLALQLGGGDVGTKDGLRLSGWKNIAGVKSSSNLNGSRSFDTGNVYFNIVKTGNTQTLQENTRLTRTTTQISSAQGSVNLSRNFKKEFGDTSTTTPFSTTGTQYISKNGYVNGVDGDNVRLYNGFHSIGQNGIVNKNGKRYAVTDFKDGYVTNGTIQTYAPNGFGADSFGGEFKQIDQINASGSPQAYQRRVYDTTEGTGSDRGVRRLFVWSKVINTNNQQVFPTNTNNNTVVASYENGGGADQYFKPVDLDTGNRLSADGSNNLTGLILPLFTVNKYGEVINKDNQIRLQRHKFNQSGLLVSNTNDYVYEHVINGQTYSLNDSKKQIEVRNASNNLLVKVIPLAVFNADALIPTKADDYTQTTNAVSGGLASDAAKQSISINIRDMSVQGLATQTEFFEKQVAQAERTDVQNWATAPILYDVDANVLLFPKQLTSGVNGSAKAGYTQAGEAIGYKLNATTTGSNGDSSYKQDGATRSSGILLVHNDQKDSSKTRYVGLRHLDSLTRAEGDIQITGDGLAFTANDFLFAFRGEVATGLVPDSGETFGSSDRLLIVEGKLKGDLQAKIVPSDHGLGFDAKLKLANNGYYGDNSGIRFIMPQGGSSFNVGDITGTVNASGSVDTINIANDPTNDFKGALNVKATLVVNPENIPVQDLRIRNIGFSSTPLPGSVDKFSPYQDTKIGEMAFTKHTIYTNTTIRSAN